MVEQYLKDSVRGPVRKAMEEEFTNKVYIPPVMRKAMEEQDSLRKAKANERLLEQKRKETEDLDSNRQEGPQTEEEPVTIPVAPAKPASSPIKKHVAAVLTEERKIKRAR
jgi:hypothetical protein